MTKRFRLIVLLGLAIIFCLTMAFLSVSSYSSSPWQDWQTKYFQAQIAELRGTLPMVQGEEQAGKLKQEIKDWQEKKPAVQELRLSNGRLERCTTCHMGLKKSRFLTPALVLVVRLVTGGMPCLWMNRLPMKECICLLYTSDAADEEDSVDLGGRRIIKK